MTAQSCSRERGRLHSHNSLHTGACGYSLRNARRWPSGLPHSRLGHPPNAGLLTLKRNHVVVPAITQMIRGIKLSERSQAQKNRYHMAPFMERSWKDKALAKEDQLFPEVRVSEGREEGDGMRSWFGVMFAVIVMWTYTSVKMRRTLPTSFKHWLMILAWLNIIVIKK